MIEKPGDTIGYQAPDKVISQKEESEQDLEFDKEVQFHTANLMKRKDGEDPYNRNKEVNIRHQLQFGVKPEIYKTQMSSRGGSFVERTPLGKSEMSMDDYS